LRPAGRPFMQGVDAWKGRSATVVGWRFRHAVEAANEPSSWTLTTMQRRQLLQATAGTALAPWVSFAPFATSDAQAALACTPYMPNGVQQCQVGIRSSLLHVAAPQELSQWCWAACIEMVFRYHGFRVSQRRIVEDTWGDILDLPGRPDQILDNLNRDWKDDRGRAFSVSGDVYTANAITAAQDLADDLPLIIGTQGHAMVLTSLTYLRDIASRGQVTAAIVRDPWPGRGRRMLSAPEWHGTSFLARIRVQ